MTVMEAVRTRLLAIAPLVALIGARAYALTFPESPTFPAVRLQQIGRTEFMGLSGSLGLYRARIQVDVVASTSDSADPYETATAVWAALHGDGHGAAATGLNGWRGDVGGSPAFRITGVLPDIGPIESFEAEELSQVRVTHDYLVWFNA